MQFLCLIYESESDYAAMSPGVRQERAEACQAFGQALKEAGVYLGGNALEATTTATTIRLRQGNVSTTDGPFAETKEQLGGYFLIDCQDLDEALEWAAKMPAVATGAIEVRPVRPEI